MLNVSHTQVRMLGSGRPFLIEVLNVRSIPSANEVQQIAEKINSSEKKYVRNQTDARLTF
jgi:tRNA pseudouridine synthase 10